MNPALSVYLDLVRFGAAMVVASGHTWGVLFPSHPLPFPGNHAVIVFFVLSGFVIAYTADRKDSTFGAYMTARLARLWSVVIPALLLGALIIPVVGGNLISLAAPPPLDWSSAAIGSALNLIFVSEFWRSDAAPPFNAPFWSLSYEAAYYAVFAAWVFAGPRWRFGLTIACCALVGPKILLLMPCWLLGVWLYRHPATQNMEPGLAVALFVGSIVCYLAVFWVDLPAILRDGMDALWPWPMSQIGASRSFLGDYIIALLVAVNFAAVAHVPKLGGLLHKAQRPIALAASFTLSIYLYHEPLLALLRGGLQCSAPVTLLLMAMGIIMLGLVSEHKRVALRRLITLGSAKLRNAPKVAAAK